MRLWRDLLRIFSADPSTTSNPKNAAGQRQPSDHLAPLHRSDSAHLSPANARAQAISPESAAAPIQPYAGALIQCGSQSIRYTPLIDSVATPIPTSPVASHAAATSHELPAALAPGDPHGAPDDPLAALGQIHDTAQIDHDTARRDHELAKADHANAQHNHKVAQADAARARQDLRAFEEDISRTQRALDAHRVVEEIQRRMRVRPWHMLLAIGAIFSSLVLGSLGQFIPAGAIALGSVAPFIWLHLRWQSRRAFRLHYELGSSYDRAYTELLVACQRLENSGAQWCVPQGNADLRATDPADADATSSHDESVQAGSTQAQTLLQRASRRFRVSRACPPWIRCNLTPPMIPSQGRRLYLFPDHALLYEKGRIRAIVYTEMRFSTRLVEPTQPFGPPRPDERPHGPVPDPMAPAEPVDQRESVGVRSQTMGRDATSLVGSRVQRYLDRRWIAPILSNDAPRTHSTQIQSEAIIVMPPKGIDLNALQVSQLRWTSPAGDDAVHLISPCNDAAALTNAVSRLGSVYAACIRH